ncbi:MAG TPA: hypothetical protein VNB54_12685, partial [Alphaproteobacteria bacterium]|nr:hypothetical protein [Alphaproteobacteria bacterium]
MPTPVSAPGFRVSYFYSEAERKRFGWSENFFHPGPDQATVLAAATTLQGALFGIHAYGITMDFMRISDLSNFRLQKLVQVNHTITGVGAFFDNYVVDSFLFSFLGSDGRRVKQWLRGVPDPWIGSQGQVIGGFAQIATLLTTLATNGFCLRGLPRPQQFLQVTGWDQTAGTVTIPGHGWTTPLKIRIKGSRSLFPQTFNRIFRVTVVDANTVQIVGWTPIAPVTPLNLTNATAAAQYQVNTALQGPPAGSLDGSYILGVSS